MAIDVRPMLQVLSSSRAETCLEFAISTRSSIKSRILEIVQLFVPVQGIRADFRAGISGTV